MTLSTSTQSLLFVQNYLPSLWKGDLQTFSDLLDENAHFIHETNNVEDFNIKGRDTITQLFREKFTDSMLSIEVGSLTFLSKESTVHYQLISTQEMKEDGEPKKIEYEDTTTIELKRVNEAQVISKIYMRVKKRFLNN